MDARDVVRRAFQRLGVVAIDETTQPHDDEFARGVLTELFSELPVSEGMTFAFTLDTIPESHGGALALVLAAEIAAAYGLAPPVPRATAMVRLRAVNRPQQLQDMNEDGTIDDADQYLTDVGRWM